MRIILVLAMLAPAPAMAQILFTPVQTQTTNVDATARSEAAAARATADQAQAAVPAECATLPASDTATGTIGTGTACIHRPNAAAKTNVMPATAVTIVDGSFSGTWPATFPSVPTTAFAAVKSTSDPFICQVGSFTASNFSGKCWRLMQMTLPGLATGLLNLVLVPFGAPPTGSTVMVVGRQ